MDEKLDLKISDYAHKFWEKAAENAQTDILTLGKILYELIHGYSLFKGKNPKENGLNVPIQKKQKFASFLSDDVQDLLSKLLSEDKNKEVFGLKEIFSHKWMTKFYKLFKVDIEKFKQPQKKQRNSFEQKINNRKASLNCGIIITERKTEPSEAKRENLPSKSAFEGILLLLI